MAGVSSPWALPSYGGWARKADGCILSFENADGKRLVLHREGAPLKTVGAMCDVALRLDPTFRVVAYSAPPTIYADLTGGRMPVEGTRGGGYAPPPFPEKTILAKVGRFEMLHPRLALVGADERRTRMKREARRARSAKRG